MHPRLLALGLAAGICKYSTPPLRCCHMVPSASMLAICRDLSQGYHHSVYAPCGGSLEYEFRRNSVPVSTLRVEPPKGRLVRGLLVCGSLIGYCRRQAPDIIHSHLPGAWPYAAVAAMATKSALVLHVHGIDPPSWPITVVRRMLHLLPPECWAVLAVSHAGGRAFQAAAGLSYEVVPNSVDGCRLREQAGAGSSVHEACNIAPAATVGLVVASVTPTRNPAAVVQCAKLACSADNRIHFAWAGDGPMLADMRRRTDALGLASRFHWLGYRNDVPSLLASSNMLMLLSRHEGFGQVLTEAMILGVPVIATNVHAINEVVTHNLEGLLVPDDDDRAAAESVLRLAGDPQLRLRLGAAGQTTADTNYAPSALLERIARVYNRLASADCDTPGDQARAPR